MTTSAPPQHAVSVQVDKVRRVFDGEVEALSEITLQIPAGEFTAILGPSGCGKSTLLRIIAGLDLPTSGTVQAATHRQNIAYVFQDAHLLPWRSVLRNVALPLELMGVTKSDRLAAASHALEQVGLGEFQRRYPNQLSGGMKMRVSLARALVTKPALLLLDEPFAALDEITREKLDEQLRQLWLSHRMTIMFVTHSTMEATFLANRAVVLSRRPGRIVGDIPIQLPQERPSQLRGEFAFTQVVRSIYQALESGGA